MLVELYAIFNLQFHGERKQSTGKDKETKYKQEYLDKLEEVISESFMLKKSFHPISMKYKDPMMEAKVHRSHDRYQPECT